MLDRLLSVQGTVRFRARAHVRRRPGGVDVLADMANRRVMRRYLDKPVDPVLLDTFCAIACRRRRSPTSAGRHRGRHRQGQRAVLDELARAIPG